MLSITHITASSLMHLPLWLVELKLFSYISQISITGLYAHSSFSFWKYSYRFLVWKQKSTFSPPVVCVVSLFLYPHQNFLLFSSFWTFWLECFTIIRESWVSIFLMTENTELIFWYLLEISNFESCSFKELAHFLI